MLAMVFHSPLATWVYISIAAVTALMAYAGPPVGASTLAMVCHSPLAIWVYISVAAVTAAYGFALTATHFFTSA
jgi:phosphate starvation-inducible membrane PsiE